MKKALKITGITLLSLILVIIIVAVIVVWIVLTPKRVTPIVKNQVEKIINAKTELGEIDLTIFHTFPKIGLKIHDVCIINPIEGSPSDTLAALQTCIVSVNFKEFRKNKNLVVDNLFIEKGFANIYTNCNGQSNLDIFSSKKEKENDDKTKLPFEEFLLDKVTIKQLYVLYEDCPNNITAELVNFSTNINLYGKNERIDGVIDILTDNITFSLSDSDTTNIDLICFKSKIDIKGVFDKKTIIEGSVKLNFPETYFNMDSVNYLNANSITLDLPFSYDLDRRYADIKDLNINIEDNIISLKGIADLKYNNTDNIFVNADFNTSTLILDEVLPLIPEKFLSFLDKINVKGDIIIAGTANGIYNKNSFPKINVNVLYDKGNFSYSDLDYSFRDIYTKLNANIDFSDKFKYDVNVEKLSAKTLESNFNISGKVTDTTNNIFCDVKLNGDINIPDTQKVIPQDLNLNINGKANINLNAKFKLDDIINLDLMKTNISGRVIFTDLDVLYEDSIKLVTPDLDVLFAVPNQAINLSFKELVRADIKSSRIIATVSDNIEADLKYVNLNVGLSNILDTLQPIALKGSFEMSDLTANMDTIYAYINNPTGMFSMIPSAGNPDISLFNVEYFSNNLDANMGSGYKLGTSTIDIKASAKHDVTQKNLLLQWNPEFNFDFADMIIEIQDVIYPINVPKLKMDYNSKVFNIHDGTFKIGSSEFHLKGDMQNVDGYLKDSALLTAVFDFTSDHTHVDELMNLINGLGADSTQINDTELEDPEDNPFMVPLGIDFRLNTHVKKATVKENVFENVGGHVTIQDGILVLEEMGFTSKAAKMQLTAMYRSPRKNHLFLGFDFHLIDIDIEELINMIPFVDTVVPMLKSFKGDAEFHISAETYLKSNYQPKMSTLRAAGSIAGENLILLDNKNFSTISNFLQFEKKTENIIDSLNVEMTVFRDKVNLYPFIITMDDYQAVVGGRHNIDKEMSCDYHISLINSPLPIRLGLEVYGPIKNLDFKLVKPQYSHLYNPKRQNVVQTQTLRLQQLIRESLRANVKEF